MKKKIILLLLLIAMSYNFAQNFPFKFGRSDHNNNVFKNSGCESRVTIKDERENANFKNCNFNNDFYMFPVLIEDFNFKEDLPNNWHFKLDWSGDDKAEEVQNNISNGLTWMECPEGGYNNVSVANGIGYLNWEQEMAYNKKSNPTAIAKDYYFTGAMFYSIFKLKQGVFEARIKLPENNHFWPAFWLYEGKQEIDVFEFYDDKITAGNPCDTYHQMKMTLHNHGLAYGNDTLHCSRGRKFPVHDNKGGNDAKPDFFDNYHIYKCVWTDYRVEIYLDGTLVGYGTKYYDGPFTPSPPCYKYASNAAGIPNQTRDCNYMHNTNVCNAYYPWPFNNTCLIYNKVYKDNAFPNTDFPMSIIIGNAINYRQQNISNSVVLNSWNNLSAVNKRVEVDYIKIYQSINCSVDRNVCSLTDFLNQTGKTNFMSGHKINIAPFNTCFFKNEEKNAVDEWRERPLHILASDEISFNGNGEAFFYEGTFLRAEIIDCSGGFNQYQRGMEGEEPLFLTDEEIAEIEKRQNDSLLAANPELKNEIEKYNNEKNISEKLSSVDNEAIILFPNPAQDYLLIDMDEEGYYDLIKIELIDLLGRSQVVEKTKTLDVKDLKPGLYQLKFVFSHGYIVVKGFVKN